MKPVEEKGLKHRKVGYLSMESLYNGVDFQPRNYSTYTGAFHARKRYQTVGSKATEEGLPRLASVKRKEKKKLAK